MLNTIDKNQTPAGPSAAGINTNISRALDDKLVAQTFIDKARQLVDKPNPFRIDNQFMPQDMLFISEHLGINAVFALLRSGQSGHWTLYLGQAGGQKLIYDLDSPTDLIRTAPADSALYLYPTKSFLELNKIPTSSFIKEAEDGRRIIRQQTLKDIVLETLGDKLDIPPKSEYRQRTGSTDCGPCALYSAMLLERNAGCSFDNPRSDLKRSEYKPY